jgi:hypothetical protein
MPRWHPCFKLLQPTEARQQVTTGATEKAKIILTNMIFFPR